MINSDQFILRGAFYIELRISNIVEIERGKKILLSEDVGKDTCMKLYENTCRDGYKIVMNQYTDHRTIQ